MRLELAMLSLLSLFCTGFAYSFNTGSDIPIVDVHAHFGKTKLMARYMHIRGSMLRDHGRDLAVVIDLSAHLGPTGYGTNYLESIRRHYDGRVQLCISDYRPKGPLRYTPQNIRQWMKRGALGYKLWFGLLTNTIDLPENGPTFSTMEETGFPLASVHIAQPFPSKYCQDEKLFMESHRLWESVLDRHPSLVVVMAHMYDYFYTDAQLDLLARTLDRYPNLHVDLAARFKHFHRMDRGKLRDFFIRYADRIVYGSDFGEEIGKVDESEIAARYLESFRLLETDEMVSGNYPGGKGGKSQGLHLPREVLEKIYYRNALRIYPGLKDVFGNLGYR